MAVEHRTHLLAGADLRHDRLVDLAIGLAPVLAGRVMPAEVDRIGTQTWIIASANGSARQNTTCASRISDRQRSVAWRPNWMPLPTTTSPAAGAGAAAASSARTTRSRPSCLARYKAWSAS